MAGKEILSPNLGDFALKLAEIASHREGAPVTPDKPPKKKIDVGKHVKQMFTKTRMEQEKADAKNFVEDAGKKKNEHVSSRKDWADKNKYQIDAKIPVSERLEGAKKVLQKALTSSENPPSWLGITDAEQMKHSPQAAEFVARVALLPKDLQDDPNVLFREAARLACSTTSDMTMAEKAEVHEVIQKTIVHIGKRTEEITKTDPEYKFGLHEEDMKNALIEKDRKEEKPQWVHIDIPADLEGKLSPALLQEIQALQQPGERMDWDDMKTKYKNLENLALGASEDEQAYIREVQQKLRNVVAVGGKNRFNPSPKEVGDLIYSAKARDKTFYELLKKVVENPDEATSEQLDLYDRADIDRLMEIFSQSVVETIDPETGKKVTRNIGHEVQAHYQNLQNAILKLSDIEYWARNPAGDVENMTKMTNYFENKFFVEAVADPLVEDMVQCMEQAIKFIRDSNNGYIPQELMRWDSKYQKNYVDDLALQFFKERVAAGAVRDYVRSEETGLPEIDKTERGSVTVRSDKPFHFEGLSEEEKILRLRTTLRLAKGVGILTNRTIELCAFTKTPGVGTGRNEPGFSSKSYGGLTRWTNPLSELFLMYKMGDTLHARFFNSVLNQKGGGIGTAVRWNMSQFQEAADLAAGGDQGALQKKFGPDAKRITDMLEDFSFSGRFGPLSKWGLHDSTLHWTAKDCERLGGSVRLTLADMWADNHVSDEFKQAHSGKGWNDRKMNEEWLKVTVTHPGEWKKKIDDYALAYKAHIWADFVMRNPQGVASQISTKYGEGFEGKLRSKIFYELFTRDDLREFGNMDRLVMERDVASFKTVDPAKRNLLHRIAVLDTDMDSVMRYAMNSGDRPRDITRDDFVTCIKGDRLVKDDAGNVIAKVTESRRREQTLGYWERVQQEMLGTTGVQGWRSFVGASADWNRKPEEISFAGIHSLKESIKQSSGLLKDHINDRLLVHMGTEDVMWRYLDIDTLGDRHWGRRAGDNLIRAKTINLMNNYLKTSLVGRPKMEDLVKALAEIGNSEKDHDPKEAAKFTSIFATATTDIYRQRKLAGVPIVGRVFSALGMPMSAAQECLGTQSANFWSANNVMHFADLLGETRVIPNKRIIDGQDWGKYTMKDFKKSAGASRWISLLEFALIGHVLLALTSAATAVTTTAKEEEEKK